MDQITGFDKKNAHPYSELENNSIPNGLLTKFQKIKQNIGNDGSSTPSIYRQSQCNSRSNSQALPIQPLQSNSTSSRSIQSPIGIINSPSPYASSGLIPNSDSESSEKAFDQDIDKIYQNTKQTLDRGVQEWDSGLSHLYQDVKHNLNYDSNQIRNFLDSSYDKAKDKIGDIKQSVTSSGDGFSLGNFFGNNNLFGNNNASYNSQNKIFGLSWVVFIIIVVIIIILIVLAWRCRGSH